MGCTSISDLPVDVFLLICNHLDATSFVRLTATCKSLHASFAEESTIWFKLIRSTFRVANQPVVEHDGARWKKLYRKLKTQTRAYTWGSNNGECLGISHARTTNIVSWPEEMAHSPALGIISEMQCGGWSTSLLNSQGVIWVSGMINGLDRYRMQSATVHEPLRYPPGFTPPQQIYSPATAIKQFSHGRQHLLALSDNGRIWSWNDTACPAYHVKFLHHTTVERQSDGPGTVVKVVAGWSKSAALVEGSGIVIWDPLRRAHNDHGIEDTALVQDSEVVPDTDSTDRADSKKHVVRNFILLESTVLFITTAGQAYYSRIQWETSERLQVPQEIDLEDDKAVDVQGSFRSFAIFTQSGAVLTFSEQGLYNPVQQIPLRVQALQHRQVIAIAYGDYHYHALHAPGYITSYGTEPSSCGAFGLGTSTPEARLRGIRQQGIRGLQHRGGNSYLVPHAYVEGRRVWFERAKREWIKFLASGGADPEEAVDRIRMSLGSIGVEAQGEVSEWVEQEGRDWEQKYDVQSTDGDGLPTYFALNVAAAGWHSGALVLEDEELVKALESAIAIPDTKTSTNVVPEAETETSATVQGYVTGWLSWAYDFGRWFLGVPVSRSAAIDSASAASAPGHPERSPTAYGAAPRSGLKYVWAEQHFPRLRLSSGVDMPGQVAFDEWRYGRPEFALDTL